MKVKEYVDKILKEIENESFSYYDVASELINRY